MRETQRNFDLTKRKALQFEPRNNDMVDGRVSFRQNDHYLNFRSRFVAQNPCIVLVVHAPISLAWIDEVEYISAIFIHIIFRTLIRLLTKTLLLHGGVILSIICRRTMQIGTVRSLQRSFARL
jgi:hypothetical protein